MITTSRAREHDLWNQIVTKEINVKKRFESVTGETIADRYFGGQNKPYVESMLTKHFTKRQAS